MQFNLLFSLLNFLAMTDFNDLYGVQSKNLLCFTWGMWLFILHKQKGTQRKATVAWNKYCWNYTAIKDPFFIIEKFDPYFIDLLIHFIKEMWENQEKGPKGQTVEDLQLKQRKVTKLLTEKAFDWNNWRIK